MRVLIIVQNYPPEQGPVRYCYSLANGLKSNGHSVTVLTGLPHYPMGRPYRGFGRWWPVIRSEGGIRVVRLPLVMASNSQPLRRVLGAVTFMMLATIWACVTTRNAVVIAVAPPPPCALAGFVAARVRRRPLVFLLRDIEPLRTLEFRGHADGLVARFIIRFFMWLYRRGAGIVVVHDREKQTLIHHGLAGSKIEIIPHGVEMMDPASSWPWPQSSMSIRESARTIAMYAGTIGVVHGLDELLRAAAHPSVRALPIEFVIVGEGECAARCRALIRILSLSNVQMLPPVPLDEVPGLLFQADVLICSYNQKAETQLGSKFYEYCAAGKPILIHGANPATEMVGIIGNGLSCAAGDGVGLASALAEFLRSPALWRERGLRGRGYAARHFSQELRDAQWDALLRSLVG